jgi:hypothetical protein
MASRSIKVCRASGPFGYSGTGCVWRETEEYNTDLSDPRLAFGKAQ